jgi:hypothetical protein
VNRFSVPVTVVVVARIQEVDADMRRQGQIVIARRLAQGFSGSPLAQFCRLGAQV